MKTVLLGLNEINFDYIKYYVNQGKLPNFKHILENNSLIETVSENKYDLLEPWIQWLTVYTGKSYDEHKVFRLGDIVDRKDLSQIFEELEKDGISVGAISPFNVDNRLKKPAFFIPDPWTKTKASGNRLIKAVYQAVHQSVNDNANKKLELSTIFSLILSIIVYVPFRRLKSYFNNLLSVRKPGVKAIILDNLLSDIFIHHIKNTNVKFAHLFLNSGAHIQHHYLFNSDAYEGNFKNPNWYCEAKYDPLIKILNDYDETIGRILKLNNVKLIIATGLHQQPHKKMTFYWRLKEHEKFAEIIGLKNYTEILPRMSRDFLVKFNSKSAALIGENLFNSFKSTINKEKIFNVDNRGESLFVELIYSKDINKNEALISEENDIKVENFKDYTAFVAIKNGEHNGIGYLTSNFNLNLSKKKIELKKLKEILKKTVTEKH